VPAANESYFVGRERELDALRGLLADARSGQGGVAALRGEPGVGKTRTAEVFAERAQPTPALWGISHPSTTSRPLHPWIEAIGRAVAEIDVANLADALGQNAPSLAEIVPEARRTLPEVGPPTRLAAEDAKLRAFEAFAQALGLIAEDAAVLVLDDMHWADQSSLELLAYVGRMLGELPVAVVVTYREEEAGLTHPLTHALAEIDRHARIRWLSLDNLRTGEVEALVQELAGPGLPSRLIDAIETETGGNPFFVVEVVRALRAEWEDLTRAPNEIAIPEGVRSAVGLRLARLSADARRTLTVAAAFEGPFASPELQAITGFEEDRLLACIDDALQASAIRSTDVTDQYEFAHALVRNAIYDELSPSRKARLHRRVAAALEQLRAGHDVRYAAEIAEQYARSTSLPGAAQGIRYALIAADEARRTHAYAEAARFLRTARSLSAESSASIRADILTQLALVEAEALYLDDAEVTIADALEELERAGAAPDAVAGFLAEVVWALKDAGASERLLAPLVDRGLAIGADAHGLAWARLKLALYPVERRASGTLRYGRWLGFDPAAVALARLEGTEDDYARTLVWQDLDPKELEQLLARVRTWTAASAKIHGLHTIALAFLYLRGEHSAAEAVAQETLETSERLGSIFGQASSLYLLAELKAPIGEVEAARAYLELAERLLARLGPEHRLRSGSSNADEYLLVFVGGDWEPLVRAYERFATDPSFAWPWLGPYVGAFAAVGRGRLGSPGDADNLLGLAIAPLQQLGVSHPTYPGTLLWAVQAAWELDLAHRGTQLDKLARSHPLQFHLGELTRARAAALVGDLERARGHFARARGQLDAGRWPPWRAIADYDEALALYRRGEHGAEPLLAAARAQFDELGMVWWSEQAESLSRKVATASIHPDGLTTREVEILRLLAQGARNKEIAEQLVVSVHTVERHLANIYVKISARNRAEATVYALEANL
jgi:DNA-binding CsgD family transcriptional regulator/Arc/MetJ family transcription regulator